LTHAPVELHVCGWSPLHWSDVGAHAPEQEPASQTYGHDAPELTHAPASPQVSGCNPLHSIAPAVHATQLPPLQNDGHAVPAFCHVPFPSHVCG
jgi:hypothetical protein